MALKMNEQDDDGYEVPNDQDYWAEGDRRRLEEKEDY